MVDFDRPGFLLLIPAAILVQWLGTRNSLTRWPNRQKAWCGLLRAIIFSLLALALAGPRWLAKTTDPAVVLLRDVSASIGRDRQTQNAETAATFAGSHPERVAEVAFAREPQVIRGFGESSARDAAPADKNDEETDLSAALEFAATLLPADRPARIVLFSDGVPTAGRNPVETAAQLRDVEIDTVPIPAVSEKDAAVVSIKLPNSLREGEIFDLSAQVFSTSPIPSASIRVYQNDLLVNEVQRELSKGVSGAHHR